MRKARYLLLIVFLLSIYHQSTHAQFDWEHMNGPEGGGSYAMVSNDAYTFYEDDFFLYRTSDGVSWEQLATPGIYKFFGYHESLFASKQLQQPSGMVMQELILSYDNGESWIACNMPDGLTYISSIAICGHGLYVTRGDLHRLYRSTDDGETWESLVPPLQYGYDLNVWDERLYIYNSDHIWRSDETGQNWTEVTPPVVQSDYITAFLGYEMHLVVVTFKGIYSSHDNGQSWTHHALSYLNTIGDVAFNGLSVFTLRSTRELYKSEDFGDTWALVEIPDPSFTRLAVIDQQLLAASYTLGVYRWDDVSEELVPTNSGLFSAQTYALQYQDGLLWALAGSGLFTFDPFTETWTMQRGPVPNAYAPFLAVGPNGVAIVNGSFDTILVSQDAGVTWDYRQYPHDFFPGIDPPLKLLNGVLYAESHLSFSRNVWRSEDLGMTWTEIYPPEWRSSGPEYFDDQLIIGAKDTLYASPDHGNSWYVLSQVPQGSIRSLAVTGDRLFAQITSGFQNVIYTSTDGMDWQYAHTGLPSRFDDVFDFEYTLRCLQMDNRFYIVFPGSGTYVSLDTARTWLPVQLGSPYPAAVGNGELYAPTPYGVLRSTGEAYGGLVSGKVFADPNGNGIQDTGEPDLPGLRVGLNSPELTHPYYFTTTDTLGHYSLGVFPSALDTIRPIRFSEYIKSIRPAFYTTEMPGPGHSFGIEFTPDVHDLSIYSHLGNVRPGFSTQYHISYNNDGTSVQDVSVSAIVDNRLEFVSADPPPSAIYGDSMVWYVNQLPIFHNGSIWISLHVPVTTPLDEVVSNVCRISSVQTDISPGNNVHEASRTVVGSYDPNAKEVTPPDGLTRAE